MQLQVRRMGNAVELVVVGVGPAPQLQQSAGANGWQGQLTTASPTGLRAGPQRLSLPELGLQSVTLNGSGSSYSLSVTPMPGVPLARPVVSADGVNLILTFPTSPQASLQTNRLNLSQPGAVPLPTYAPPLQPRAVAPPLGDMAVGTMTVRSAGALQLSGPRVTLTLKNAPVRDVLMSLARLGNYGFVYLSESLSEEGKSYLSQEELKSRFEDRATDGGRKFNIGPENQYILKENPRPVTVSFNGESYSNAINAVLAAGGLQGRLQGRTIFAGPNMLALATYGPQVTKVYRLNQATAGSAAQYLASLGALISIPQTISSTQSTGSSTNTGAGASAGGTTSSSTNTSTSQTVEIQTFGGKRGPLLGVTGTIDGRLGTITLVGDSSSVGIAENYLRQIDLRQRQVALSVRILDVSLDNASEIDNSFAFRWGNNFIVNDSGQLLGAFGRVLPPTANDFRRGVPNDLNIELTPGTDTTPGTVKTEGTNLPGLDVTGSVTLNGGSSQGTSLVDGVRRNPGANFPSDQFFDFVRAQIVSGSTKLLASPTLILQENPSLLREGAEAAVQGSSQNGSQGITNIGLDSAIGRRRANEGVVRVGTNVVTGYETETPSEGGNVVCTPQLSTAGLVLGARVEKIDDNGFVTFVLSPSVSAITGEERAPQGCGSNLNILSIRSLDTGALRVRDGQTLIMTGVISDFDRTEVSKWPILGDLPLVGQFFRASSGRKEKRELVIMVSPRIIDDGQGGVYGYGYQPGTSAGREFLGSAGAPTGF